MTDKKQGIPPLVIASDSEAISIFKNEIAASLALLAMTVKKRALREKRPKNHWGQISKSIRLLNHDLIIRDTIAVHFE